MVGESLEVANVLGAAKPLLRERQIHADDVGLDAATQRGDLAVEADRLRGADRSVQRGH